MTFSLAKPGTWAVNEKLTSAQMNQLDADHVKSVDKTGDSITAGLIQVTSSGEIRSTHAAGITSTAQFGIRTSTVDGINTDVVGGISLSGSANFPRLLPARSKIREAPFVPLVGTSGWSFAGSGAVTGIYYLGPGTAATVYVDLNPWMHNGATLTEVALVFAVTQAHPAITSMALPKINVARTQIIAGISANNGVSLNSGGQQTLPAPGSAAAYVNSNNTQVLVFPCDQNNVIDTTQYKYTAIVNDENGTNSVASSTAALGFRITHGNITDMSFQ